HAGAAVPATEGRLAPDGAGQVHLSIAFLARSAEAHGDSASALSMSYSSAMPARHRPDGHPPLAPSSIPADARGRPFTWMSSGSKQRSGPSWLPSGIGVEHRVAGRGTDGGGFRAVPVDVGGVDLAPALVPGPRRGLPGQRVGQGVQAGVPAG